MHKSFYASGFLYNSKSHQILLLQSEQNGDFPLWSLLGGENNEGEDAEGTFQRVINKSLNLNLKTKNIYPIYDYFQSSRGKVNYVFYAEIKNPPAFKSFKEGILSWVTFKDTIKLLFSANTKRDVIIGERVINLNWRLSQNIQ